MTTTLIPLETVDAAVVFQDRSALDKLLAQIREATATLVPDTSTEEGRKLIASTAYKVARSKTAIDEAGFKLVEGWKRSAKVVDVERKYARDTLEALQEEIRAPLDAWNADRAAEEQRELDRIRAEREAAEQAERDELERVRAEQAERDRQLREREAAVERAEQAERDRLAAVEREQAEAARLEQVRQEAAAQAERDAAESLAAGVRREAALREQARLDAEQAARDQQAAIDQALARQRQEAEQAEAERVRREQARAQEEAARTADIDHRRKINLEVVAALVAEGFTDGQAKRIVTVAAAGTVRHLSITY